MQKPRLVIITMRRVRTREGNKMVQGGNSVEKKLFERSTRTLFTSDIIESGAIIFWNTDP